MIMNRGSAAPDPFRPSRKRFPRALNMDDRRIQWILYRVVGYLATRARPVYVGAISLEVHVGIDRTEMLLEHLCDQGVIRYLTEEEKRARGFDQHGALVILLNKDLIEHVER